MVLAKRETDRGADDGADGRADRIRGDRRRLWRLFEKDARQGSGSGREEDRDEADERNIKPELTEKDDRHANDRESGRAKLPGSEPLHAESGSQQGGRKRDRRIEHRRDAARDDPLAPVEQGQVDAEVEDAEEQSPSERRAARKALAGHEDEPGEERCGEREPQRRSPYRRHSFVADADREERASPDQAAGEENEVRHGWKIRRHHQDRDQVRRERRQGYIRARRALDPREDRYLRRDREVELHEDDEGDAPERIDETEQSAKRIERLSDHDPSLDQRGHRRCRV